MLSETFMITFPNAVSSLCSLKGMPKTIFFSFQHWMKIKKTANLLFLHSLCFLIYFVCRSCISVTHGIWPFIQGPSWVLWSEKSRLSLNADLGSAILTLASLRTHELSRTHLRPLSLPQLMGEECWRKCWQLLIFVLWRTLAEQAWSAFLFSDHWASYLFQCTISLASNSRQAVRGPELLIFCWA